MYGPGFMNPYDPHALLPPMGRLAVTIATRENISQIAAYNADGSCAGRLTHTDTAESNPVWSPHGTRIAFMSMRTGGWNLFSMAGDGEDVRQVTSWPELWPGSHSWSPNDRHIVFSARRYRDDHNALYIINAGGSRERLLLADPGAGVGGPEWSPRGDQILFTSNGSNGLAQLETIRPDGSGRRVLARHDALSFMHGAWSPDARTIAFHASSNTSSDIYLMDADGSNIRPIASRPTPGGSPCWSPDGRHIAFSAHCYCEDRDFQVYIMNADGTGISRPWSSEYGATIGSWGPVWWVWERAGLVPEGRVIPLG